MCVSRHHYRGCRRRRRQLNPEPVSSLHSIFSASVAMLVAVAHREIT